MPYTKEDVQGMEDDTLLNRYTTLVSTTSLADYAGDKLPEDIKPNMRMLKGEITDRLNAGASVLTTRKVITRCLIACQTVNANERRLPEDIEKDAVKAIDKEFKGIQHKINYVKFSHGLGFAGSIHIESLSEENEGSVHF